METRKCRICGEEKSLSDYAQIRDKRTRTGYRIDDICRQCLQKRNNIQTKYCPVCDKELPVTEFYRTKDGRYRAGWVYSDLCKFHSNERAKETQKRLGGKDYKPPSRRAGAQRKPIPEEYRKEYGRQWRENHPEKTKEQYQAWAEKNKDQLREYKRQWYQQKRQEAMNDTTIKRIREQDKIVKQLQKGLYIIWQDNDYYLVAADKQRHITAQKKSARITIKKALEYDVVEDMRSKDILVEVQCAIEDSKANITLTQIFVLDSSPLAHT